MTLLLSVLCSLPSNTSETSVQPPHPEQPSPQPQWLVASTPSTTPSSSWHAPWLQTRRRSVPPTQHLPQLAFPSLPSLLPTFCSRTAAGLCSQSWVCPSPARWPPPLPHLHSTRHFLSFAEWPPFPSFPTGNWLFPGADGFAEDYRTSRWQGLAHLAGSKSAGSLLCFYDSRENFVTSFLFGLAQPG